MAKSVMQEIMELEQAREDYKREQYRADLVKRINRTTRKNLPALFDELSRRIQTLGTTSKGIPPQAFERFKGISDTVAGDSSVENKNMKSAFRKRFQAEAKRVKTEADDISMAFEIALEGHRKFAADGRKTFRKDADGAMTRYMLELQLAGGPGGSPEEINAKATQAIASRDAGAIEFWSRNYTAIAGRALEVLMRADPTKPGMPARQVSARQEIPRMAAEINREFIRQVADSGPERDSLQRIADIQETWGEYNGDRMLADVTDFADRVINNPIQFEESFPFIEPRERTPQEAELAAAQEANTSAQARLDRARG